MSKDVEKKSTMFIHGGRSTQSSQKSKVVRNGRTPEGGGGDRAKRSSIKDLQTLRSNFNTRGVNSREKFWFFGHSSLSHHAFLMKIGGNLPLGFPELSKPSRILLVLGRTQFLRPNF